MNKLISNHIDQHSKVAIELLDQSTIIEEVCLEIYQCLDQSGKLLICGNGGSASDAQHIAAEFVGRFLKERKGLPAIALNTDTSAMTAISNDYGYENIFSRQIESLANEKDILIAISTSGNSKNIINAIKTSNQLGCITVGLLGKDGGVAKSLAGHSIIVPSNVTAHIQEMHITIGHIICSYIDSKY